MSKADIYLDLVNNKLPNAAKDNQEYPVRFNHCFARICLDCACGGVWYDFIKKPAYKNIGGGILDAAIKIGEDMLNDPSTSVSYNKRSLEFRKSKSKNPQL